MQKVTEHSQPVIRNVIGQMLAATVHKNRQKHVAPKPTPISLLTGVAVSLVRVNVDGFGVITEVGDPITLPNTQVPLSSLMGEGAWDDKYRFITTYTFSEPETQNPDERKTLAEFVMTTLREWERLLSAVEATGARGTEEERAIISAMELLKSTYSYQELGVNADIMRGLLTIHPLEEIPA